MSIKTRIALLLGLLLLGFLGTLLALRILERREWEQLVADDRRARSQLLNHWVDITGRALPQFADEVAQAEDVVALAGGAESEANRQKLEALLQQSAIDMLWVMRADGTPRAEFSKSGAAKTGLPLAPPEFLELTHETPRPRFFAQAGDGLLELCVRRLQTRDAAREWLVVSRRWDDAQLASLARLTDAKVSLGGPAAMAQPLVPVAHIVLLRPLTDWRGHPLRTLRIDYDASGLERSVQTDWQQTQIFIAFGVLVLLAVTLALQGWVLRPLAAIGESLESRNPKPVEPLSVEKSELGRVAQLVLTSFAQHEALARSDSALRRTLDERARLGRDLHDGVIQSLYAAGMGLAGIRALLNPAQIEAAARLEQTRAALNETIHDVRNFIVGLEPEALKEQTFAHAVNALLESMQGIRKFRATAMIDETLAARLSLSQRVHALQIGREAVSNALRHGSANTIAVELKTAGGFAEFQVSDDGSGFNPTRMSGSGQGLRNLAQRAQELGGKLAIDSKPREGARVKLVFSLQTYD